jgi:hypothetical protein
MSELTWGWEEIATVLFWRLCPNGYEMPIKALVDLPMDRCLFEDRDEEGAYIRFTWISVEDAFMRANPIIADPKNPPKASGVTELQGTWQKICVCLLWQKARDGITIRPADKRAVEAAMNQLLLEGHADPLVFRFVSIAEAARIRKAEIDNRGQDVALVTDR